MDEGAITDPPVSRGKVFLSGSRTAVSLLHPVLAAEGFAAASAQRVGAGELWSTRLQHDLQTSDVVIALLDPPKDAPQTFYEVGLAEGLGKPILLVVSPQTRLPVDLTGHMVVRPGDDLPGAVVYALRQWRDARSRSTSERAPESTASRRSSETAIGPLADDLRDRLRHIESTAHAGFRLEQLVQEALEASAEVVVEGPDPHQGVDLGVWSDALTRSVGNPLLVEVKSDLGSPAAVHRAEAQISAYLRDSTARAALLVYGGAPSEDATLALRELPPTIIPITIDALLERLRSQPLSELMEQLDAERSGRG